MSISIHGQAVSETEIMLYASGALTPTLSQQLLSVCTGLEQHFADTLIDSVVSYQSLLLCFSPHCRRHPNERLTQVLVIANQWLRKTKFSASPPRAPMVLPIYYGSEAGADFLWLCEQTGLSAAQLIQRHSAPNYTVFAIGFSPGFAFMGQLDQALHLPRRPTPRNHVPQGSLAIAHDQTAIYPSASPGGWHLMGRCPLPLFNPQHSPSNRLAVGDCVRFAPISRAQFIALGGQL